MIREFTVDRGDAGRRLDLVLRRRLADLGPRSRASLQRWIAAGRVRVDEEVCARQSRRLPGGAKVAIDVPAAPPRRAHEPEPLPLSVLFEDEHLLVVDKPAGLVVHPTGRYPRGTLVNALLARALGWPDGCRPGLVHRLDRDTSGLVLVARHAEAHARLARAMMRRAVRKEYFALVYGEPRDARGRITLGLERDAARPARVRAVRHGGRPSSTAYELLARSTGETSGLSALACTLHTGRLHQARVHLAAAGLPIVGDAVYGEPRWKGLRSPGLAEACRSLARHALHAWRLSFAHPFDRADVVVEAPLPAELRALVACAEWDRTAGVTPPGP
jgi:23S rRNA pseudouridine1911/1915/1917 synthase